jgi:transposase
MSLLTVSLSERRALTKQIQQTKDVKILKRAQAFLWLSKGLSVNEISKRVGVSRQTVYDWVSSYQNRCKESFRSRLQDRPKPGRPARKSETVFRELDVVLGKSPRDYGYCHSEWTASLLSKVLERDHTLHVSTKTIRRCLKKSCYVWKRPGYALSRQSATWVRLFCYNASNPSIHPPLYPVLLSVFSSRNQLQWGASYGHL